VSGGARGADQRGKLTGLVAARGSVNSGGRWAAGDTCQTYL
jgi:hypothetical protein